MKCNEFNALNYLKNVIPLPRISFFFSGDSPCGNGWGGAGGGGKLNEIGCCHLDLKNTQKKTLYLKK